MQIEGVNQEIYNKLTKSEQATVDIIFENLSSGAGLWKKGWINLGAPVNPVSGTRYRGTNNVILSFLGMQRGYSDNRWITFKQMEDNGWQFKKDEQGKSLGKDAGIGITFFDIRDRSTRQKFDEAVLAGMTNEEKSEYIKENFYRIKKSFTVFNGDLIDGIPEREKREVSLDGLNERVDRFLENWNRYEAKIGYGGSRAYYSPDIDFIGLPRREWFISMPEFYQTSLHEVGHSTGHEKRLNRDLSGAFGGQKYAAEELRAEIASMFLEQEFEIQADPEHLRNNSAYIQSWLNAIKADPSVLFSAISDADKIAKYVIGKEADFANVGSNVGTNVPTDAHLPFNGEEDIFPSRRDNDLFTEAFENKKTTPHFDQAEGGVQGGNTPLASKAKEERSGEEGVQGGHAPLAGGETSNAAIFDASASFASQVDAVLSGADTTSTHLKVMNTPRILREVGALNYPILMTAKHLKSIVAESGKESMNYHGVDVDILKQLPELLADPVMLMDSMTRDDSVVMLTATKDKENNPVIGAIMFNGIGRQDGNIVPANILLSVYGKDNFYDFLQRNVEAGTVLYWSKEKSQALPVNPGIQFPDVMANLDSDIIIRKAKAFVKQSAAKSSTENSSKKGGVQKNGNSLETLGKRPTMLGMEAPNYDSLKPSEYAALMARGWPADMTGRGVETLENSSDKALIERAQNSPAGDVFTSLYNGLPVTGEQEADELYLMLHLAIQGDDKEQVLRVFLSSGQDHGKSSEYYSGLADEAMKFVRDYRNEAAAQKKPTTSRRRSNQNYKA